MARGFVCPGDFVHVLGHSPPRWVSCWRLPPVFRDRGPLDFVQRYAEGGVSGSDGMQMLQNSILGAVAVVPAVAGLDVGAQALGTGHKLLFGDELHVDGALDEVGSYLVPRVERMPSLVENRRHPAGCRFRSYSS